ncbi:hypothetical protein [Desertivirga xinjiangensis]|uniref:hypothetical protein n=1 Tax=Desertivirga xinjiangensis TaxID=539206 RepID=UPI0021089F62|nr:hypothetical protein [Pedobacter xinjiangensis]
MKKLGYYPVVVAAGLLTLTAMTALPDLIKSEFRHELPDKLHEISGISFSPQHAENKLFAVQDEAGILFTYDLSSTRLTEQRFAGKGDYEDVAAVQGAVFVLRSDGAVFTVQAGRPGAIKQKGLLPAGEYEGLYADRKKKKIFVLAKKLRATREISLASS